MGSYPYGCAFNCPLWRGLTLGQVTCQLEFGICVPGVAQYSQLLREVWVRQKFNVEELTALRDCQNRHLWFLDAIVSYGEEGYARAVSLSPPSGERRGAPQLPLVHAGRYPFYPRWVAMTQAEDAHAAMERRFAREQRDFQLEQVRRTEGNLRRAKDVLSILESLRDFGTGKPLATRPQESLLNGSSSSAPPQARERSRSRDHEDDHM